VVAEVARAEVARSDVLAVLVDGEAPAVGGRKAARELELQPAEMVTSARIATAPISARAARRDERVLLSSPPRTRRPGVPPDLELILAVVAASVTVTTLPKTPPAA
jgi:hypothetical protein